MIPPDDFIPLAERTGLIRPISEWVIAEASRQAAVWPAAGNDHAMSINVPPDTCQQIGAEAIERLIRTAGGEPSRHHARDDRVIDDDAAARADRRVGGAPTRSGSGSPSMTSEPATRRSRGSAQLPVTFLKIDRSFVHGLPELDTARMLVTAIMYLAKGFGLEVIAEGVETEAQRDYLLESGCRYAQGYLFSPAVEADQISPDWLSGAASVGQTAELLA